VQSLRDDTKAAIDSRSWLVSGLGPRNSASASARRWTAVSGLNAIALEMPGRSVGRAM
jgi:hypothetical protein